MNVRTENQGINVLGTKVAQLLSSLLAKNCQPSKMLECLDSIRCLLDCLPLDTVEHGMANLRIRNAQRFLESNETGAARFEIRMLKGSLKDYIEPGKSSPRTQGGWDSNTTVAGGVDW